MRDIPHRGDQCLAVVIGSITLQAGNGPWASASGGPGQTSHYDAYSMVNGHAGSGLYSGSDSGSGAGWTKALARTPVLALIWLWHSLWL